MNAAWNAIRAKRFHSLREHVGCDCVTCHILHSQPGNQCCKDSCSWADWTSLPICERWVHVSPRYFDRKRIVCLPVYLSLDRYLPYIAFFLNDAFTAVKTTAIRYNLFAGVRIYETQSIIAIAQWPSAYRILHVYDRVIFEYFQTSSFRRLLICRNRQRYVIIWCFERSDFIFRSGCSPCGFCWGHSIAGSVSNAYSRNSPGQFHPQLKHCSQCFYDLIFCILCWFS